MVRIVQSGFVPVRKPPRPGSEGWPWRWSWLFSTQLVGARLHIPLHHPEPAAARRRRAKHISVRPRRAVSPPTEPRAPVSDSLSKTGFVTTWLTSTRFLPKSSAGPAMQNIPAYYAVCINVRVREADRGDLARWCLSSNTLVLPAPNACSHAPPSPSHRPWGFAGSKPLPETPAWPACCSTASSNKSRRDEPSRTSAIGCVGHENACDALLPACACFGAHSSAGMLLHALEVEAS
ncbi:hypothetical protein QBC39DRAFT_65892 [Podospora conica]|nr:hypothetical protein QBC39DRAFT_65892 [Schizothecium conicum]